MELFERNNPVPSSKMMTFFRNETFSVQANYTTPTLLSPNAGSLSALSRSAPCPSARMTTARPSSR